MSKGTSSITAMRLTGQPSSREVVLLGAESALKWHQHDYPSPLARWNHHPEFEIHMIAQGEGRVLVGDYLGDYSSGHLAIIGSNLPHHWISSETTKQIDRDTVLQFDGELLLHTLEALPDAAELRSLLDRASRGLEFHGESRRLAAKELMAIGSTQGLERLSHFLRLLSLLANAPARDCAVLASEWFAPHLDAATLPIVDRVLQYITRHLDGELRMVDAAQLVGMTGPTFSRFFKRSLGRGFNETVCTMRLVNACRLLRETTVPISTICYEVGFQNLSNFNRCFQREVGSTPSGYRKKPKRWASR
ncbi:AraC family transcriptional regulator [Granulicella cerasi]|uniref:AraC family transcriptional regulator n=1 Tax=Granulicella cerasi TaxID=741063 RepID=A0ABW1Z6G5_9BACT|nr:AraC family transcriptional regulator [Granulicella cerasi]